MAKRDMRKIIKGIKGRIKPRYDMTVSEIYDLLNSPDPAEAIFDAFEFGYAQGMKAAKAQAKKKA